VDAREDRNLRLLRARNHMDRHYARPLDVEALAAVAYMARSHFIQEFRATFGQTPHRYLQRRRIERAMHLLRGGDESITDICLAVGYTSLGTFSRTFTEVVGQSPSVYRSRHAPAGEYVPGAFTMRWTRPAGRT
jgi:AraC-like DNA-binding protein